MTTSAMARVRTAFYLGGSVTASVAALEKLFGPIPLRWRALTDTTVTKRRPYGSRRVAKAAAGHAMTVSFVDGEEWTYRITGPHKRFIDRVLAGGNDANVRQIRSQRKTKYGPEPDLSMP